MELSDYYEKVDYLCNYFLKGWNTCLHKNDRWNRKKARSVKTFEIKSDANRKLGGQKR